MRTWDSDTDDGRWGLISSFYTICWAAEYAMNKRSKGLPSAHKCASGFSQDAKEIEMRLLLSHSWIHVRRGWLYLKFKESGYPLKNVLNILMSVPWPIALGSVRKRIFQLFGLAVSGASRSRTSMNGPNQEEAISAPEQRRVHIFLRLQDRKTFYGIG